MIEPVVQATTTPTDPPAAQAAAETTQPVAATVEQASPPTMTLEAALKELSEVRKEAAKYRTTAKATEKAAADAEEKALKEQGKFKELYEKSQADIKKATDELAKRDRADLQRKVAARVGIPEKLAGLLPGETEAEMEVAAQDIRSALPAVVIGNDAARGSNGSGVNSDATKTYGGMSKEQFARTYNMDVRYVP